jgi:hypothetical protein
LFEEPDLIVFHGIDFRWYKNGMKMSSRGVSGMRTQKMKFNPATGALTIHEGRAGWKLLDRVLGVTPVATWNFANRYSLANVDDKKVDVFSAIEKDLYSLKFSFKTNKDAAQFLEIVKCEIETKRRKV